MFCQDTCKPVVCLDELLSWSKLDLKQKYKVEPLTKSTFETQNGKSKILLCHDMKNNYQEDKFMQGHDYKHGYRFYEWNLIDTFIYFSHYFVTIPTESWINAAHRNGVSILGTLITEFDQGYKLCKDFISDMAKIDKMIEKLVDITEFYGFDGWLINIENKIDEEFVQNLVYFVDSLTKSLKNKNNNHKVIWYDSVIKTGELKWQNELNNLNKQFFDVCDGFFVNYTWKHQNLENTLQNSGERINDIYIGIDVFGRGCLGGGGFQCNLAFDEIQRYGLNVALFAPGWVHEANKEEEFVNNSQKFWSLIEKYSCKRKLAEIPLLTNFSQGCGDKFFINGILTGTGNWYNLNLQSTLSSFSHNPKIKWCFDDAYHGGNCIEIEENSSACLFELDAEITFEYLKIVYAYKKIDDINGKISIEIKYLANDILNFLLLAEDVESTKDFEKISNEESYDSDAKWIKRSFLLKVNRRISFQEVVAHNASDKSILFGHFGVSPASKHLKINSLGLEPLQITIEKVFTMHLLKEYYFCAELSWTNILEIDYFNVFMKKPTNEKIVYIGSAKSNQFKLCCLLKNYDFTYSIKINQHGNDEKENYVELFIQKIFKDNYQSSLNDSEKISIWIPGKAKVEKIIYDFEIFSYQ